MGKKRGFWGKAPSKMFASVFLFWLKMHLPISCLPLVIKTFKNIAASFYHREVLQDGLEDFPIFHVYHLPTTISSTLDLAKSNFSGSNVKLMVKEIISGNKTPLTRGANLRTKGICPPSLYVKTGPGSMRSNLSATSPMMVV